VEASTNTNSLYELARTIANDSSHTAAVALRKLAQAGYENLDQVDKASDWLLLSIPGVGIRRLCTIRRMTREEWMPPSQQAIRAASRLLSASRFALRFWPPEDLHPFAQSSRPSAPTEQTYEQRLALELFARAARKAINHCAPDEVLQILHAAQNGHWRLGSKTSLSTDTETSPHEQPSPKAPCSNTPVSIPSGPDRPRETDHFAYPRDERHKIVQAYRAARQRGEVRSKERWAQFHHNISAKTLLSYEREFPES